MDTGQGESKGLAESVPDAEIEAKDCDIIETVDISKDTQKESFSTDVDSGAIEEKAVIPDSELEQTETSGFTEQISEIVPDEDGVCSEGKTERKDGAMGESKVVYVEEDTKRERDEGAVGESKVVYVEEDTKTEGEEGAVSESKGVCIEEDTKIEREEGDVGESKVVFIEEITKSDSKNVQNVVEAAPRLITDINRPAVSEQEEKGHVMQQHLYPDLRKDIERMKAEEEQVTVNVLKLRSLFAFLKSLDKQGRPRSDCFFRSSLIRVFPVCYVCYMYMYSNISIFCIPALKTNILFENRKREVFGILKHLL